MIMVHVRYVLCEELSEIMCQWLIHVLTQIKLLRRNQIILRAHKVPEENPPVTGNLAVHIWTLINMQQYLVLIIYGN